MMSYTKEDLSNMWDDGYNTSLKTMKRLLDDLLKYEDIELMHIHIKTIKRIYQDELKEVKE